MKTLFILLTLSVLGVASVHGSVITTQDSELPANCMAFAHSVDLSWDGNVMFPNDFGRCSYGEEEEGSETQIQMRQIDPVANSDEMNIVYTQEEKV